MWRAVGGFSVQERCGVQCLFQGCDRTQALAPAGQVLCLWAAHPVSGSVGFKTILRATNVAHLAGRQTDAPGRPGGSSQRERRSPRTEHQGSPGQVVLTSGHSKGTSTLSASERALAAREHTVFCAQRQMSILTGGFRKLSGT